MRAKHVVWWVAGAVVALGCASPGAQPGDGSAVGLSPSPSTPAVSASVSVAAGEGGPPGDGAPHNAENNAWKQRADLTAAQRKAGADLADRILPKLEALRAAGDLTPASTRSALIGFGLAADDVQVTPMWAAADTGVVPPGAAFGVRFSDGACLVGSVRPDVVTAEVTGAGAEFGCLEPQTH